MALRMFLSLAFVTLGVWIHAEALLTDICLGCICEKTSSCSCSNGECGPFNIEPVKSAYLSAPSNYDTGGLSFEDCAADVRCSRRVFRDYVNNYDLPRRYRRVSQCELAARIQEGGDLGAPADVFWLTVQSCATNE